jgi:hypothetical protein
MDNKIVKDLIIFGIIIIIAAIAFSFIFSPSSVAHDTNIQLLNKGDFGSNSTVYIKLTDTQKNSLSNKTVHVKLLDKKGKVVYNKSIDTHTTGVGMAKLSNVSAGEYTLNITFDGDKNYTGCSLSKKITVEGGEVEDVIDNSTLDAADLQDIADTQAQQQQDSQQSSQSYTPQNYDSGSDSSQSSSSSDSGYDTYYDVDGNEMDVVIDPDGNQIDPSDE